MYTAWTAAGFSHILPKPPPSLKMQVLDGPLILWVGGPVYVCLQKFFQHRIRTVPKMTSDEPKGVLVLKCLRNNRRECLAARWRHS